MFNWLKGAFQRGLGFAHKVASNVGTFAHKVVKGLHGSIPFIQTANNIADYLSDRFGRRPQPQREPQHPGGYYNHAVPRVQVVDEDDRMIRDH